jgi:hypothetical protein
MVVTLSVVLTKKTLKFSAGYFSRGNVDRRQSEVIRRYAESHCTYIPVPYLRVSALENAER